MSSKITRPVVPGLEDASLFNNWFSFNISDGRKIFFGLRQGADIAATWLELEAIDEDGGWARDVDGLVIRLGTKMPKAEPDPRWQGKALEEFMERLREAYKRDMR